MIAEITDASTLINTADMKKYLVEVLMREESLYNTISEALDISKKEAVEFLSKCYKDADFQYQSNKILVHFASNYLPLDEIEFKADVVARNLKNLMGFKSNS